MKVGMFLPQRRGRGVPLTGGAGRWSVMPALPMNSGFRESLQAGGGRGLRLCCYPAGSGSPLLGQDLGGAQPPPPSGPTVPLSPSSIFHILFPTPLRATSSHPGPDHPSPSPIPIFPGLKDDKTSSESPFLLQAQEPLLSGGFFFFCRGRIIALHLLQVFNHYPNPAASIVYTPQAAPRPHPAPPLSPPWS